MQIVLEETKCKYLSPAAGTGESAAGWCSSVLGAGAGACEL